MTELRCGYCDTEFTPPLVNCVFQVGGGTGLTIGEGRQWIGRGGSGVRITDEHHQIIHECGNPDGGLTSGRSFRVETTWEEGTSVVSDDAGWMYVVPPGQRWVPGRIQAIALDAEPEETRDDLAEFLGRGRWHSAETGAGWRLRDRVVRAAGFHCWECWKRWRSR